MNPVFHSRAQVSLQDCWAKTDESGAPALSVRDHCINVGSVAKVLAEGLPGRLRSLIPEGGVTLVAAHDIGKITPGFLLKSQVWASRFQDDLALSYGHDYERNHCLTGLGFLRSTYPSRKETPNWLISVAGHHGKYLTARPEPFMAPSEGAYPWLSDLRKELLDELIAVFGELPTETGERRSARLHWYTGYMIFSDWVGSSQLWFPLADAEPLAPGLAYTRAQQALKDLGWSRRKVRCALSFSDLFKDDRGHAFEPRPLQRSLIEAMDAPGLYVIEAPMGEGKTEAALAAAYRRWAEGEEKGLYFALPTQLTSNRILHRVAGFLENVLHEPSVVSLIHASAWLTGSRITEVPAADVALDDNAFAANQWFSDNRKSLLMPFGVGTIDQALLGVLPAKFASLRLFALSGKVVVIDEVHSYDPYTSGLIGRAVQCLMECGCSVIVLSATLTAQRRAQLVAAAGAAEHNNPSMAYPLITRVRTGESFADAIEVPGPPPAQKSVKVSGMSTDTTAWVAKAAQAAEEGACVLVIRNTVALAQETFRQVKSCLRGEDIPVGLVHSRFPQYLRNENEKRWVERLGKDSSNRPNGCILVGTQVLEQSLDIDSDILFTDLAPTDLLLQRIGRLHRHERPRPSQFSEPLAVLLMPRVDWEQDPVAVKNALGPSSYVYPCFSLYQADSVWRGIGEISLPSQIRELLERSALPVEPLPHSAKVFLQELKDAETKMKTLLRQRDQFKAASMEDAEDGETRWNSKPSSNLVLLKKRPVQTGSRIRLEFLNGSIRETVAGVFDYELAKELHLNAVRVSSYLLRDLEEGSGFPLLVSHFRNAFFCICHEDSTDCALLGAKTDAPYRFTFTQSLGVAYSKIEQPGDYEENEIDWF